VRTTHVRTSRPLAAACAAAVTVGFALAAPPGADETPGVPVEVHEWSVWVGSPSQGSLNAAKQYGNAMPNAAGTRRPKLEEKDLVGKFPVAPVSVVEFFGEPSKDVDVDLRAKKGSFLAHWPPGAERPGRVQWFKSSLSPAPPENVPPSNLPEAHWVQSLRGAGQALYLQYQTHFERFVAYDVEVALPAPVKLRGGPNEYTLQNLTDRKLLDVAVIAPTEKGYRVGWLDELPAAAPKEEPEAKKKEDEAKKKRSDKQKADEVFKEAESKDKKDKDEPAPLPPEGDPTVRARVDQVLNRPITIAVEQAPRKELLDLIANQARFRYELDEKTIAKGEIDLGQPAELKAANVAARDALADVLGGAGLSYRVTEAGTLYVTTAARLAEDGNKKGTVVEGPPVKLTLSQPLKPSDPSYRELTRDTYARRLAGQGLREGPAQALLAQYGKAVFEPGEVVVLAHLSREALDEAVLLDVFPPPKKFTRVALVVTHGIDPRLQDRARALVRQLGDDSPGTRDEAEGRLFVMGPVAVPALEDALADKDVEVVFRVERLLLKLNRPVP
jgi:hypothetical protein